MAKTDDQLQSDVGWFRRFESYTLHLEKIMRHVDLQREIDELSIIISGQVNINIALAEVCSCTYEKAGSFIDFEAEADVDPSCSRCHGTGMIPTNNCRAIFHALKLVKE